MRGQSPLEGTLEVASSFVQGVPSSWVAALDTSWAFAVGTSGNQLEEVAAVVVVAGFAFDYPLDL